MKQALALIAIVTLLIGCATFNSNVYKTQGTIVATVDKAVVVWTDYYVRAAKDPAAYKTSTESLMQRRATVDAAYVKYQAAMDKLDVIRTKFNQGLATQDQVMGVLQAASDSASTFTDLISMFTK